MRAALAARHMGKVARAYRQNPLHDATYGAGGISQTLLGQWLGLTQAQVSRVENGKPIRSLDALGHWATIMRIPPELLWFDMPGSTRTATTSTRDIFQNVGHGSKSPLTLHNGDWLQIDSRELADLLREGAAIPINADTATRLVHEWLVTEPPQVIELGAGRQIGEGLVGKVERRIAHLRRMDDFMAGGDLCILVEQELQSTVALLRTARYSQRSGLRLLNSVAELSQLAGWVVGDAGRHDEATRYYTVGVKAAHAADNLGMAGNLISALAYLVASVGNPHDAILWAQSADTGGRQATPAARALFKERLAWAYARAGDRRSTERTLADVETIFDRRHSDSEPEWVYWLNEDEISVMAGRCFVELGQGGRAISRLSDVLDRYDKRHTRELALYTSWLAEAQVQQGEIEEAVALSYRTLELTSQISSARSDDRIRVLLNKLQPYSSLPVVADFEAAAKELTSRYP
jgi:transcriptional regulator with XRE-family HTH domain